MEYGKVCEEVKMVLLLEKDVERVDETVVEEVGKGKWWQ